MKRIGFTLIELIVVLVIIAILIAITLPCLQSFRQQAKTVLCASNIRQLTLGLLMYETENRTLPYAVDDHIPQNPPPDGYSGNAAYDRMGWWWFNYISDYSPKDKKEKRLRWCPSRQLKDSKFKDNVLYGNYGVNRSVCKVYKSLQSSKKWAEFTGTPLCTKDMQNANKTLLIVDCGYSMITCWHATDIPPVTFDKNSIEDTVSAYVPGLRINDKRSLWPGQEEDAINGRHPGKTINAGFADGHISRKKADDLLVEKTNDGYKNRGPLWVP